MSAPTVDLGVRRHRLRVRGVVQGVGFRPFVHRLALDLGLGGYVGNDTDGVFVEVEGAPAALAEFERRLRNDAPPLARVDTVEATAIGPCAERGFRIVESRAASGVTFVAPDAAVCDDCVRELLDPSDRRYRYPFVTCTNCGPRFTITVRLPYDRPNTTMATFRLCPDCAAEYDDPADRRFHAQPLACARCGPAIRFEGGDHLEGGLVDGTDAVVAAFQRAMAVGAVVAVKGLGGYHLACSATDDTAVRTLRDRKGREHKPFAVMTRDLAVAGSIVHLDDAEAEALSSPRRPIVLLDRRASAPVAPLVAPGSPSIGVMLPYTPLHHLLFQPVPGYDTPVPEVLVMTSGNISDEPIAYDDADARARLARLADAWLVHDRPIHVPCDDSVVRLVDGEELPIRRSRGYAPLPVALPGATGPILAVGGELKNTFCLASGTNAWMSQHIGDTGSVETLLAFERSTTQFQSFYEVDAVGLVADAHPGYHTRQWAEARAVATPGPAGTPLLVQHHHAHVAAVMAEHEVPVGERVIGFAFDGTGYGADGAIWGGEALVAGYEAFERVAHLRYVALPGGDAVIRKPARAALAHLRAAGIAWDADLAPVRAVTAVELAVLDRQLERGIGTVATSSIGRLFDAVSSLLDVRHEVSYEAQAAMELEHLAGPEVDRAPHYELPYDGVELDPGPLLRAVIADVRAGVDRGPVAAGFHLALAGAVARVAEVTRDRTGIRRVGLSGGVFQNVVLLRLVRTALATVGFEVLVHRVVPANDGGLALGQVAVAAARQHAERSRGAA